MATCGMCGGQILWARTVEKKGVPLDLPPNPNGNAWLEPDPEDAKKKVVRVVSANRPKPDSGRFYTMHFVGCRGYKAKKRLERMLAAPERS